MQIPQLSTSRWFIYVSSSLLVFLCLAVLVAGLMLFVQSSQPRYGEVSGSSMEPTLLGPRFLVTCSACQAVNPFTIDAWDPNRLAACLCCGSSILADDEVPTQRGETIRYRPTRWATSTEGMTSEGRIRRGDIVVLERESGLLKELKRVVGLPHEKITIRNGDIWVDDQRYEKTLSASLSQSVLVAVWDSQCSPKTLDEFTRFLSLPPNNELSINAHDSHVVVPTHDFGIAMRFSQTIAYGRFAACLSDTSDRFDIEVVADPEWSVTCNNLSMPRVTPNPTSDRKSPQWLILALIDGRILVGDELGGGFALPLASTRKRANLSSPKSTASSITISSMDHASQIDLALVFRDVVYRGYRDTPEETFPPGPGYVVLGDNVSISDDSRGPAGYSSRWDADRIKGVVLQDSDDLAGLLRQSSLLRVCGCDTPKE